MHNYERKIQKLLSEGKLPHEKGKLYDYRVAHDDCCQIYNGGECNCDPEITATEITKQNRERVVERISEETREFREDVKKKIV